MNQERTKELLDTLKKIDDAQFKTHALQLVLKDLDIAKQKIELTEQRLQTIAARYGHVDRFVIRDDESEIYLRAKLRVLYSEVDGLLTALKQFTNEKNN